MEYDVFRKKFQNISSGFAPVIAFLAVFSFLLSGSDRFLGFESSLCRVRGNYSGQVL